MSHTEENKGFTELVEVQPLVKPDDTLPNAEL
jgi:hypothetical protein